MAKKENEIDQDKVKGDAEKIASGGQTDNNRQSPPAETRRDNLEGANATGAAQKFEPGDQQAAPAGVQPETHGDANLNANRAGTNEAAKREQPQQTGSFAGPAAINQGNPGAGKPGQAAAKQPTQLSDEEAEDKLHEQLVEEFGPDYVRAQKGEGSSAIVQTFSRRAWDLLGPLKADGSKDGYKPIVRVPKEVRELQNRKAAAQDDQNK
jgi:hypothetical protein